MGLGQLSLLLTWSFIEITILIIIPLFRFNHLHNSLGLKYFLVQSIGSITLLTLLIFYIRLFDQKSLFLFIVVWKVALVFIFILPPDGFRESQTGVSVTCLRILKMTVKKNISNTLFLGQEYSDFQKRLYKLSIRIIERNASVPPTLTLIALGLLRQHIKRTRILLDENVASLHYFRKYLFKFHLSPEEFSKVSCYLQFKLEHPGLQLISKEFDSRLSLYLDQGGKLPLPKAGSELVKFYPQLSHLI